MTHIPVQILIADDHFVVQSGLKLVINGYYADYKIFSASNFKEIFKNLQEESFDLLILDANFPEGNTLSIIEEILSIRPQLKILMYTALEENMYASKFLSVGVKGFLSKLADEGEIISAVTKILRGEIYMSRNLKEIMLDAFMNNTPISPFEKLSKRELEIMTLLVQGEANLEISNKLQIKPPTVSTYKKRIFEKLVINNISDLISLYNLHLASE